METTLIKEQPDTQRAARLLSRVRQRQLMLARRGRLAESFNYARRAERIRRSIKKP